VGPAGASDQISAILRFISVKWTVNSNGENKRSWRSEKKRRSRAEIQPVVDLLVAELQTQNPGLEVHVGGSYRRGAPTIGDIDILVITEAGTLAPDLLDPGVILPERVTWQRRGARVANGEMALDDGPLLIDVWAAKPESRGAMLAFFAGPMQLNLRQRARAKAMNMALSQNGLTDRETGEQLDNGSEESIYRILGWPWLTSEERQRYAP
jgi:DNA polymerase/3'-5' exonuclease PolX